ncbi:hypothetical protein AAFC00_004999 [Neodothiora populina]|uniref:Apple domain-containing protein n=1 Tax=Neodothiora populina TaxID=2781224 RepID=A0ABR3P589_9PEZI
MFTLSLIALSLALPTALGSSLESRLVNSTSLVCATRYAAALPFGGIPTATVDGVSNHGPVMYHITWTSIVTSTPNVFWTRSTECRTNTTYVIEEPRTGVYNTTTTIFETKTLWDHVTTSGVDTVFITGTSRTTTWVPAPTGFKPIRDTRGGWRDRDNPRLGQAQIGHPHKAREEPAKTSSISTKCRRPLVSKFPVAVECTELVQHYTKQYLIATADWASKSVLPAQTSYRDTTTLFAAETSTILRMPRVKPTKASTTSSETSAEASSSSSSAAAAEDGARDNYSDLFREIGRRNLDEELNHAAPAPSKRSEPESTSIITNTFTTTQTPFTVRSTWTGSEMRTTTKWTNATHTVTALAACAPTNMMYFNHKHKRINGIAPNIHGSQVEHVIPSVANEYDCCAACVGGDLPCAYSLFQLEGRDRGRCLLYVSTSSSSSGAPLDQSVVSGRDAKEARSEGSSGRAVVVKDEGEVGSGGSMCKTQEENFGVVTYRGRNGQAGYVASNGVCGYLGDGDLVFPLM